MPTYFDHSKGGAYPHDSSLVLYPIFLFFAWVDGASEFDGYYLNAIQQAGNTISAQAIKEGQQSVNKIMYSNYALPNVNLETLFGPNVDVLKATKRKYDPNNVMGLAGGFKL